MEDEKRIRHLLEPLADAQVLRFAIDKRVDPRHLDPSLRATVEDTLLQAFLLGVEDVYDVPTVRTRIPTIPRLAYKPDDDT